MCVCLMSARLLCWRMTTSAQIEANRLGSTRLCFSFRYLHLTPSVLCGIFCRSPSPSFLQMTSVFLFCSHTYADLGGPVNVKQSIDDDETCDCDTFSSKDKNWVKCPKSDESNGEKQTQ